MIYNSLSFVSFCGWHPVIYLWCVCPWFRSALTSCLVVPSARVSTLLSTFGLSSLLILTFLSPIWLTLCLHLFRCSQQQWPSSRLVRPRCQVSFFILPAVHSILQLSSLRSREGKSAVRGRKRERGGGGGGRDKQNYCAPCCQLKWISFQTH